MKSLFIAITAAGLLSACATSMQSPGYDCPLDEAAGATCASLEDAYRASKSMTRDPGASRVQSVFDRRVQAGHVEAGAVIGQPSNYPEPGEQGMPVFQQPKVMRVWVAPYVDADGNLRSGEYTYFSTPGRWNYGTLNKSGAAAGMFEPGRPENLGFNPVTATKKAPVSTSKPSAPPEAQQAAQAAQAQQKAANAPATDATGSITQPYQRLGN